MALDTAPLLRRKRVLAVAMETTNGTIASLADADCVCPVYNAEMQFTSGDDEREQQEQLTPPRQGVGEDEGTCEFEFELQGAGASGVPGSTRYLRACGMSLTGSTLTPVDGATETISLGLYRDGSRLKRLAGCMGNAVITLRNGKAARVRCSMRGVPQRTSSVAMLAPSFSATIAPRLVATFTIGAVTYRVPQVEIDLGNEVILREDVTGKNSDNDATGYRAAYITNRRTIIKVEPEALPFSSQDWNTIRRASTTVAFAAELGSAANNTINIDATTLQLLNYPQDGERNGMLTDALEFLVIDDPIEIAYS